MKCQESKTSCIRASWSGRAGLPRKFAYSSGSAAVSLRPCFLPAPSLRYRKRRSSIAVMLQVIRSTVVPARERSFGWFIQKLYSVSRTASSLTYQICDGSECIRSKKAWSYSNPTSLEIPNVSSSFLIKAVQAWDGCCWLSCFNGRWRLRSEDAFGVTLSLQYTCSFGDVRLVPVRGVV